MKHLARKRFGQHFLIDAQVIDAIKVAIDPQPGQVMVEIGPGLGALTRPLLERLGTLTVIELDRDLAQTLRLNSRLTVLQEDALKVDFSLLLPPGGPRLRVVGNLPYNISTPILFHLLNCAHLIVDQHFMLQKEVVERMVAQPATSAYGRLSVMLQWRYSIKKLLLIGPQSFDPPPRVDSAVVRMVSKSQAVALPTALLSELVRVAFSQRRKLLRHTLGHWLQSKGFAGQFDLQRRAEEVSVDEYLALALTVTKSSLALQQLPCRA